MHPLVGSHGLGGVRIILIRRSGFGALGQGENEDRAEAAGEPAEGAGAQIRSKRFADVGAKQVDPVLFVSRFSLGDLEQNLALVAAAAAREVTVNSCFCPLGCEIAPPAANLVFRALRHVASLTARACAIGAARC